MAANIFDQSMQKISKLILVTFCSALAVFAGHMEAAVINVPLGDSIQDAIDLANDGDTIQLEAGTYIQEVQVVSKSLDIVGAGQDVTFIQAPDASTHLTQYFTYGANYWCIIMIDNQAAPVEQTVNISDLTVDGSDQQDALGPFYGSPERFFAIGYHNANGTVSNVHTTNTKQTMNFNELAGGGIVAAADTGTVVFNVADSLVDFYQRIGIDCRGSALTANITNTQVDRGYVLTPNTSTATPNGIQFSGSATGTVVNSTVLSNIATVVNASGSGIIIFGAGSDVSVTGNIVNNNDYGIVCISNGENLLIDSNIVGFTDAPGVNVPEGIAVQDTAGLTILSYNIIDNIPGINMDLISSTDQDFQLTANGINGGNVGLQIVGSGTAGPVVTFNGDAFTGTSGYYVQEIDSPNDTWPSTASVSFDGLISGHITVPEYDAILAKIYDFHNDPALGLVLDYIEPELPFVSGVAPASGAEAGGEVVTISGTGFISSNTLVYFGDELAESLVISNTEISAIVPAGTGTVDVTVVTPFGTSPIVTEDEYTYEEGPLLPPGYFNGDIVTVLNRDTYVLKTKWSASPSSDVVMYRIYDGCELAFEGLATFPYGFTTCIGTKLDALQYNIVSVNSNGDESDPLPLNVVHQ